MVRASLEDIRTYNSLDVKDETLGEQLETMLKVLVVGDAGAGKT